MLRLSTICLLLFSFAVSSQAQRREISIDHIKEAAAASMRENKRVSIKVKGDPLPVRRCGRGPKELKRFSGSVVEIHDEDFVVMDTDLVLGDICVTVPFEKVADIKRHPAFLYRLRKTGEIATVSAVGAAITPVILPGYIICMASNGKLCTEWTSPR